MELNLREIRKKKGLTQNELALAVGATKRQIGAWERGENDLPMEFILKPDGSEKCFYVNGSDITYIPHIDGIGAIDQCAEKVGAKVPFIELGTPEAPWGFRFFQACGKTDLYNEIIKGEKPQSSEASNTTLIELINAIAQALISAGESVVK